jgi:hypothetical protein
MQLLLEDSPRSCRQPAAAQFSPACSWHIGDTRNMTLHRTSKAEQLKPAIAAHATIATDELERPCVSYSKALPNCSFLCLLNSGS